MRYFIRDTSIVDSNAPVWRDAGKAAIRLNPKWRSECDE
jgi:hypothetical protein